MVLGTMNSTSNPTRVLVIDDDPMSRELLSLLLEQEGYAVQSADSGESALASLGKQPAPHLVLADAQLPGISGSQLARKLRRICGPSAVLLAISGSRPTTRAIALFDGFLLKPFQIEQVTAALLASARPARSAQPEPASGAPRRSLGTIRKRRASAKQKPFSKSDLPVVSDSVQAPEKLGGGVASSPEMASNIFMNDVEIRTLPQTSTLSVDTPGKSPVLNEKIYRQLAVTVSAEQLHEMYSMCVNDARRRIAGMRSMVAEQDSARFVREAHAIKGGCGMLGATELHHMAAELEAHGLEPGSEGTAHDVNFLDKLSAACDRLERMLGSRV
jgi:CheY-like chemotaxis protein/HPt (histidine-containing phosphotransfer) domain-containing protein